MKLPSLKVSLPLIFLCWCVAGVLTFGNRDPRLSGHVGGCWLFFYVCTW